MSKYGKEDVYVTASDGSRVLREMLSEYEKTLANMPRQSKSDTTPKILETKQKEDKVSNSEINKVNDDAIVVNYIMLARIYDLLTVIGDALGKGEDVLRLMELHKSGQLMSPPPVIATADEIKDEEA